MYAPAEQLAGLAELVNNGNGNGFEGRTITLATDIDVSYSKVYDGADAGNYTLPYFNSLTGSITPAPQSIDFQAADTLQLKDIFYSLSAETTSGLPILFRLRTQDEEFASISSNVLTLLKAGEIEVTAYVEVNSN